MRVNFSKAVAIARQFDNKINQSRCSEKMENRTWVYFLNALVLAVCKKVVPPNLIKTKIYLYSTTFI